MNFFIKNFISKCDQIRRKLRIWSHLLIKSLMGNFIFSAVLLRKTQNLSKHKNFHKHNNNIFSDILLVLVCLLWTSNLWTTKEILKKDIFIDSLTKINFNSSNPYKLNTITDKCTLIRGLREVFLIRFPLPHQISSPNPDRTYMQSYI